MKRILYFYRNLGEKIIMVRTCSSVPDEKTTKGFPIQDTHRNTHALTHSHTDK